MRVCLGECSHSLYKMPIAHKSSGKHRKRKPKTLIPVEVSGRCGCGVGAGRGGTWLGSPPVVGTAVCVHNRTLEYFC